MSKEEEKNEELPPSKQSPEEDAEAEAKKDDHEKQEETEDQTGSAATAAAARRPPGAPEGGQAPPSGPPERWRGGYRPEYPPGAFPPGGEGYPPGMPPYGAAAPWQHPYPPPMNYPPMYPPYQHPPPYGAYGAPPPYYQDPRYPPEMPPGMPPPYESGGVARAPPRERAPKEPTEGSAEAEAAGDFYEGEEDKKLSGPDASSASRARLYVKSKVPTRQEVLDRRSRKNAQSRARAAKLRVRVAEIELKPASERNEEEAEIFEAYQHRRYRKNDRSRERAIEKKSEIDRILSKPEKKRTKIENEFLRTALTAKRRKNEGDRVRRQRIKSMKKAGMIPGYVSGMPDIPMSPLPPGMGRHYPHHPGMPSPGPFASPGMMGFASPARRSDYRGHPGPHDYMQPAHPYAHASPTNRSQLHMPQRSSEVAQHRHPDGSMTISIGRGGNGAPAFGGEPRLSPPPDQAGAVNMSDMLFYDNGEGPEGQQSVSQGGRGGGDAEGPAQGEPDEEKDGTM